jgi:hypothetical protein
VFVQAALGGPGAQLREAPRETVAGALELLEIRDPRAGARHGHGLRGDVGEATADDLRELGLELCDLRTQRRSGGQLGPGRRGRERALWQDILSPVPAGVTIDYRLLMLGHEPLS